MAATMTNTHVDTAVPTLKVMRLQKPDLHMVGSWFVVEERIVHSVVVSHFLILDVAERGNVAVTLVDWCGNVPARLLWCCPCRGNVHCLPRGT